MHTHAHTILRNLLFFSISWFAFFSCLNISSQTEQSNQNSEKKNKILSIKRVLKIYIFFFNFFFNKQSEKSHERDVACKKKKTW